MKTHKNLISIRAKTNHHKIAKFILGNHQILSYDQSFEAITMLLLISYNFLFN